MVENAKTVLKHGRTQKKRERKNKKYDNYILLLFLI